MSELPFPSNPVDPQEVQRSLTWLVNALVAREPGAGEIFEELAINGLDLDLLGPDDIRAVERTLEVVDGVPVSTTPETLPYRLKGPFGLWPSRPSEPGRWTYEFRCWVARYFAPNGERRTGESSRSGAGPSITPRRPATREQETTSEEKRGTPQFLSDLVEIFASDNRLDRAHLERTLAEETFAGPRPTSMQSWADVWARVVRRLTAESGRVLVGIGATAAGSVDVDDGIRIVIAAELTDWARKNARRAT